MHTWCVKIRRSSTFLFGWSTEKQSKDPIKLECFSRWTVWVFIIHASSHEISKHWCLGELEKCLSPNQTVIWHVFRWAALRGHSFRQKKMGHRLSHLPWCSCNMPCCFMCCCWYCKIQTIVSQIRLVHSFLPVLLYTYSKQGGYPVNEWQTANGGCNNTYRAGASIFRGWFLVIKTLNAWQP